MPEEYLITRDDRGWWAIGGDSPEPPLGYRAYPTETEALDHLRTFLAPQGLTIDRVERGGMSVRVFTRPSYGPSRADITLRLATMPKLAELIDELSGELKRPAVETITQALVLLKIIIDAGKEGKRVTITDDDLAVEKEILIPGQPHDEP